MSNVGLPELAIVLIIALIVFGPKRRPELGRSLGRGIREFRGSLGGESDDDPEPRRGEPEPEPPRAELASPPPSEQAGEGETAVHDRN
jgi:sec-independent protein translocase protein TatA